MYRTDAGGRAIKCNDMKLMTGASTWGTRLSQLARQTGTVRIVTYSLPDIEYVHTQLKRRPSNIYLIANSRFENKAREIKCAYPDVRVAVREDIHSKILLIAPHTVYISSANFGDSDWVESTIGLHSREAHDWYVETFFTPLWSSCREVIALSSVGVG